MDRCRRFASVTASGKRSGESGKRSWKNSYSSGKDNRGAPWGKMAKLGGWNCGKQNKKRPRAGQPRGRAKWEENSNAKSIYWKTKIFSRDPRDSARVARMAARRS